MESVDAGHRVAAEGVEPEIARSRLELLAVVRGLEALDGPTRVTLITRSRYVSQGLRCGINDWRRHQWQWECFGRWVPIRDHDLWRRVDRTMRFHRIDCRRWRFDHRAPAVVKPKSSPRVSRAKLPTTAARATTGPRGQRVAYSRGGVGRRQIPRGQGERRLERRQRHAPEGTVPGTKQWQRGWCADHAASTSRLPRWLSTLIHGGDQGAFPADYATA